MKRCAPFAIFIFVVGMSLGAKSAPAPAQETKTKTCRMEQQCKWVNFKKVCTYVKVCR